MTFNYILFHQKCGVFSPEKLVICHFRIAQPPKVTTLRYWSLPTLHGLARKRKFCHTSEKSGMHDGPQFFLQNNNILRQYARRKTQENPKTQGSNTPNSIHYLSSCLPPKGQEGHCFYGCSSSLGTKSVPFPPATLPCLSSPLALGLSYNHPKHLCLSVTGYRTPFLHVFSSCPPSTPQGTRPSPPWPSASLKGNAASGQGAQLCTDVL